MLDPKEVHILIEKNDVLKIFFVLHFLPSIGEYVCNGVAAKLMHTIAHRSHFWSLNF